jgi:hypothetical protein
MAASIEKAADAAARASITLLKSQASRRARVDIHGASLYVDRFARAAHRFQPMPRRRHRRERNTTAQES